MCVHAFNGVCMCVCMCGGGGGLYQANVSIDIHLRLEQLPKVKFYPRVLFLYLKIKQSNLAFLNLTSSSDMASYALSHSSSVQRSFFCSDVIAITSRAPDVVNLVCIQWRLPNSIW